jgi:hypothetical protein
MLERHLADVADNLRAHARDIHLGHHGIHRDLKGKR